MTGIQWTDEVWNPTTGCDRVSAGCDHCYALKMAKRLKGMGQAKYQNDGDPRTSGPGFGLTAHPDALTVPLRWHKPRRVFVNSMSDLGHARVPADFLAQVWGVMAATPQHTYQILTKRPTRMRALLASNTFRSRVDAAADAAFDAGNLWADSLDPMPWPLPNVWMGTSIELDRYCRRADDLRQTPAAVRFLSLEPLLGPLPSLDMTGIDWAIVGGESGPGSRALDLAWARDIIERCREAGTAVFVKQLGARWAATNGGGKGGDMDRWPEGLRIREFPRLPEMTGAA
jgi:protein gp37